MRNLMLLLLVVLLGINGLLLWQSREENKDTNHLCAAVSSPMHHGIRDVKTSLLPGVLGLIP